MVEQGVSEGAAGVARGGVGDHACRFVDSNDVLILIEDIQGNGLGNQVKLRGELEADLDLIAWVWHGPFFARLSIDQNAPCLDEMLEIATGIGIARSQELIQPFTLFGYFKNFCRYHATIIA